MTAFVLPLLIGVVAGLRSMTAPAAVSWAARAGWLELADPTPLAFFGYAFTPWIFTALALGELVTDQLPTTPAAPCPCNSARGSSWERCAVEHRRGRRSACRPGSSQGSPVRSSERSAAGRFAARLAAAFGRDRPAALIEDAVAIGGALLIVVALP